MRAPGEDGVGALSMTLRVAAGVVEEEAGVERGAGGAEADGAEGVARVERPLTAMINERGASE